MLTATRHNDGSKVAAWEADREDRPFLCHCCQSIVTLRRGGIRAAHFAHQPPVTCEYGTGESEEHRRCKIAIYESLRADARVTKCELERNLGTVRPDVSAYINNVPVAIEVQLSRLSLEKIIHRTMEYRRKGIYVLWLPIYHEGLRRELYRPQPWELWLRAAYFGRVYYWLEGTKILSVHFRDYYLTVRGRTRDYQKLSRLKVPLVNSELTITDDLKPIDREELTTREWSVPAAKLFIRPLAKVG